MLGVDTLQVFFSSFFFKRGSAKNKHERQGKDNLNKRNKNGREIIIAGAKAENKTAENKTILNRSEATNLQQVKGVARQ